MSKMKRVIWNHDAAFRQQAARLVIEERMSVRKVAKDHGIAASTLHGWVAMVQNGTWSLNVPGVISGSPGPKTPPRLPSSSQRKHDQLSDLENRNRELEARLRRMTMERDVLKKAMAYCLDVPK